MVLYVAKQLKLISTLFKYSSFLCHSILITLTLLSNQKWMEESKNVAKFLAFLWKQSHPIIVMMTMGLIEIVMMTCRKSVSPINFNFHFKRRAVLSLFISVGQIDRFVHVAPRSLCPGPNRPLDTKKVIGNTGNHLRSKPKIWIFVDFQAKSRLYAIA